MDAVDIPQVVKTLNNNVEGIPKIINAMEAAQRKCKRTKLVIIDEYLHALVLKSLLQSGENDTETLGMVETPRGRTKLSE